MIESVKPVDSLPTPLGVLGFEPGPLFAVLDAARDPQILLLLRHWPRLSYQSLYDGKKGDELAEFAPYLVSLEGQADFLEALLSTTWGRSCGIFLACAQPFKEVRRHLRRFLMAKTEDNRGVYFRYYDPRVLRVYLPTCTAEEAKEFFGMVNSFFAEAQDACAILKFTNGPRGMTRREIRVNRA